MSRIVLLLTLACAASLRAAAQDATATPDAEASSSAAGADATDEQPAAAPSAEGSAANKAFEALVAQWRDLIARLRQMQQDRDAAQGEARTAIELQMNDVRNQASQLLDKIAEAGLAVYRTDSASFPEVTATLLKIAEFHVIGDVNGDGGDQYERALPLVEGLLEAGAGEKFSRLYLLGGMAAYCTGQLDKAERYLQKTEELGNFANLPQRTGADPPTVKLLLDAHNYLHDLPEHRKHWAEEQSLRAAEAQADNLPRVKLTTTQGDIIVELFENEAPQSVANFLTLVKEGYYDGVLFHRVLPLFMAQGGDPTGSGSGGPGYTIRDEQQAPKARRHFRGSLSMANTGAPNSGGSQFFLTFAPTSYLDGRHAVFGRVIEGMDVAASLKRYDPQSNQPKPKLDRILRAEVLRDRGHDYEFEKLRE